MTIWWTPKTQGKDPAADSGFRGVSLNGKTGWQIMCMVDGRQQFIATVSQKLLAALIHDVVQIQNNGIKVKTNFNYSQLEILGILSIGSVLDFRSVNIGNQLNT